MKLINRDINLTFQLDQDLVVHLVVRVNLVALAANLQLKRNHEAVAVVRSLVEAAQRVLLRENLAQDHVNAILINHIHVAVIIEVAAKDRIEIEAVIDLVPAVMNLISQKENQDHGKNNHKNVVQGQCENSKN